MNRQEAIDFIHQTAQHLERLGEHNPAKALEIALETILPTPDPDTGGKMRIDIPSGNDSVRASPGFQRDGGDKTERRYMANQCVICGQEMPEGDQVCGNCRRQHGY